MYLCLEVISSNCIALNEWAIIRALVNIIFHVEMSARKNGECLKLKVELGVCFRIYITGIDHGAPLFIL